MVRNGFFFRRRVIQIAAIATLSALAFVHPHVSSGQDGRTANKTAPQRFPVIAYIPEYRFDGLDIAVGERITELIAFSIEPRPNGELDTSRLGPGVFAKLRALKDRHGSRVLVALGGWERSRGFAPIATNAKARAVFASNLTRFCREHRLDGADIDWEHPANAAENEGYGALLAELKHAFAPHGLLLTMALADWQDPGALAYQSVDRIHVMAYDHDGPRHSTFEHAKADLNAFVARGVPKAKLCLGLPFYGRNSRDGKVEATYAELVRKEHPAHDVDEAGGFYFNGIDTIKRKTRYANDQGFGGVMIWELGQDAVGADSLLHAIDDAISKR
jgi:GH18 family chitinase